MSKTNRIKIKIKTKKIRSLGEAKKIMYCEIAFDNFLGKKVVRVHEGYLCVWFVVFFRLLCIKTEIDHIEYIVNLIKFIL